MSNEFIYAAILLKIGLKNLYTSLAALEGGERMKVEKLVPDLKS